MKYAIVKDGIVVGTGEDLEGGYVCADFVEVGWNFNNNTFTPPLPPTEETGITPSAPTPLQQLEIIDSKKIRAITDAILLADTTRLAALEYEASLLRPHIESK